jgi:plastocyanin
MAHKTLIALGLLLAGACSSSGPAGSTPPPPPPPSNPTPTTAVDVRDNSFAPVAAQIDAGSTVTWTWRGSTDHNVTFETGGGSSGTKSSGTHQRTFTAAGTVRYRCTIHSSDFGNGMSGSVVVQ